MNRRADPFGGVVEVAADHDAGLVEGAAVSGQLLRSLVRGQGETRVDRRPLAAGEAELGLGVDVVVVEGSRPAVVVGPRVMLVRVGLVGERDDGADDVVTVGGVGPRRVRSW